MRLLYTVQRYGPEIVGGSEAACRMFAERLVEHGHEVHVLTSCASRFTDWVNEYPAGTTISAGVNVHRLPVSSPRDPDLFAVLDHWAANGPRPIPIAYQEMWMRAVGPALEGHREWLRSNAAEYDAVIHMTYLFATTTTGLPVVAGRVPVVLQPTAHDEPSIRVQRFDTLVRLADSFIFLTPEEEALVRRRFFLDPVGVVSGIGFDPQQTADPSAIRSRLGLGDDPYVVYLGRIDPAKGAVEAWRFFDEYKRRRGGPLKLVVAGEAVVELPTHPDVVLAGFLSEADKRSLLAGATALVQPSQLESFSIVLCEAWLQGVPALVHASSPVLVGQARRSHGAIPYAGYARFEAAVDLLTSDPTVGNALGAAGRRYVETTYSWPTVLDRIEEAIGLARERFEQRRRLPGTAAAVHARG